MVARSANTGEAREQEKRENREDRIERYRSDEWEPERVDSNC